MTVNSVKHTMCVAVAILASAWAAWAQEPYIGYYSLVVDYGGEIYGEGVTGDGGMYGEIHTYGLSATLISPSGRYAYNSGSSARVSVRLPTQGESGRFELRSTHDVWCTYYGQLLAAAVSSAFVNVAPPRQFTVTARAFIPPAWIWGPNGCTLPGTTMSTSFMYKGDNRSFSPYAASFRTQSKATVIPDRGSLVSSSRMTGQTRNYAYFFQEDSIANDCWKWHAADFGPTAGMNVSAFPNGFRTVRVKIYGGSNNPLVKFPYPSPDINWNYTVDVNNSNPSAPTYTISGSHECYPAHEVYIGTQRIHGYTPPQHDLTFLTNCLLGFNSVNLGPRSDRIY